MNFLTFVVGILCGTTATLAAPSNQRCKGVSFTVSGSAMNFNLTSLASDFSNAADVIDAINNNKLGRVAVSGTQQIAGWYCQPSVSNANNDKLQFLMPSITTNRESWTAQGGTDLKDPGFPAYKPEMYSWVDYANKLGYPTLAMDHLGQGASSHPDPVLVVQSPYEIALYHDLAGQIKAGTTKQLPRSYSNLIYIGNSYGSEIGNAIAQEHPEDFGQFVLTGFSYDVDTSLPGVSAQAPAPAALVDPSRFGTLLPGYLTSTNEPTRTASFFGDHAYVDFEQTVADFFFQRKDVVSVGQFITTYAGTIMPAPAYTGRVLTLTGEHDQAFCGSGSSALTPQTECGRLLPDTGKLFPNADYSYYQVPRSGHALINHQTSQQSFRIAHSFLAGATYGK